MPRPHLTLPQPRVAGLPPRPRKILIAADNPGGEKLEDLLGQLINELHDKCDRIAGDATPAGQRVLENNRTIIALLGRARDHWLDSQATLAKIAPDPGPTGVPRLGLPPTAEQGSCVTAAGETCLYFRWPTIIDLHSRFPVGFAVPGWLRELQAVGRAKVVRLERSSRLHLCVANLAELNRPLLVEPGSVLVLAQSGELSVYSPHALVTRDGATEPLLTGQPRQTSDGLRARLRHTPFSWEPAA